MGVWGMGGGGGVYSILCVWSLVLICRAGTVGVAGSGRSLGQL